MILCTDDKALVDMMRLISNCLILETIMNVALQPLKPIKTSFLKSIRMLRQSYRNPLEHGQALQAEHGNVVMQKTGRMQMVHLFGADAHQLCLLNPDQILSNKKAWDMIIGRIFPNGLMLRDGDDHRYHRRLMQAGFKSHVMQQYRAVMLPQIQSALSDWHEPRALGPTQTFPKFKQLTLDLAATIFLGMDLGVDAARLNRAFETTVAASMPRVPIPIPGNLLWRGIRARAEMVAYFHSQIAEKRAGDGQDMFSLLCRAEDESGDRYTDQEIVDHMIFLMMAAHDTTTSTLTSMTYLLAKHPAWQQKLFEASQKLTPDSAREQLNEMTLLAAVMKEALRLYPPLSTLPKYSLKAFAFEGYEIPAGSMVVTYPIHTHYMAAYWAEPYAFNPERFLAENKHTDQHPYSFVPFSGGAHMCIGLHFAEMQIKLVMNELLQRYRWSVPEGYVMPVQQSPISKPKDGLPIVFEAR